MASSVQMGPMSQAFVRSIERFAEQEGIEVVRFRKGHRKEEVAQEFLRRFEGDEGVLFIGKAQEKAAVVRTETRRNPETGAPYPWLVRSTSSAATRVAGSGWPVWRTAGGWVARPARVPSRFRRRYLNSSTTDLPPASPPRSPRAPARAGRRPPKRPGVPRHYWSSSSISGCPLLGRPPRLIEHALRPEVDVQGARFEIVPLRFRECLCPETGAPGSGLDLFENGFVDLLLEPARRNARRVGQFELGPALLLRAFAFPNNPNIATQDPCSSDDEGSGSGAGITSASSPSAASLAHSTPPGGRPRMTAERTHPPATRSVRFCH